MYVISSSLQIWYSVCSIWRLTADVHSSKMANLGLWYSSRAIASRCFSPRLSSSSQLICVSRAPGRVTRYPSPTRSNMATSSATSLPSLPVSLSGYVSWSRRVPSTL